MITRVTGVVNRVLEEEIRASRFRLTVDQFSVVFGMSVLLLPELLLIVGIVVWWERRN